MRLPRLLLGVLAVTACAAMLWVVVGVLGSGSAPRDGGEVSAGQPVGHALDVLRRWDAARARAWASADVSALRSLYTAGSAAGVHDAAMLRRWRDRGLRVEDMQTQVLAARVAAHTFDRVVLVVTDRLARAVATGRGHRLRLPDDRVSTRRVTVRRVDGSWRVASVLPSSADESTQR
jgi:hypothetical protein